MAAKSEDGGDESPTIKNFLETNHRLFTVIGVFGALSVYFSDLGNADDEITKLGVSASLLLFLSAAVVGYIETSKAARRVRTQGSFKSTLRLFPYSVIMYGLFFLGVSITAIIGRSYSKGGAGILATAFLYFIMFLYWAYIYNYADYGSRVDGELVKLAYDKSPILALIPTGLILYYQYRAGDIRNLLNTPATYDLGIVLKGITIHFLMVFGILSIFEIIRWGFRRYKNRKQRNAPDN